MDVIIFEGKSYDAVVGREVERHDPGPVRRNAGMEACSGAPWRDFRVAAAVASHHLIIKGIDGSNVAKW